MSSDPDRASTQAWLKAQQRIGRRGARPALALSVANTLLAIGQAYCAGVVLGAAFGGIAAAALWAVGGFAVLALARAPLGYFTERASFAAGASARKRLRTDALASLFGTGPALLRESHSSDLASIVVDRIEAIDGLFSRWLPSAAYALAGPLLVAIAVAWRDPIAALMLAGCGLVVPAGMAVAGLGAAAASTRQFTALARLQARFLDRIRGISTIVLLDRAEDEARALRAAADELRKRTMRVLRVAFLSSTVLDLALAAAMIMAALRYMSQLGEATPAGRPALVSEALFVLLLVPEFFVPIRTFSSAYQDRLHATAAAQSLAALPPLPEPAPPRQVRTVAARGVTVSFENVTLVWDARRGAALKSVSFRVPAGETLVLAGPSGSGKSSIIEILLGFVRPTSGRVTINGADISELVPQALARLTSWIGQRPMLFSGSLRENIRFARPEATDAEIEEAARAARVTEFANELPAGLDTQIGESGYGLSGGQAQRIAVARAFLKNAPLLLLDEPTAHLDPGTEAEVFESLRRLAVGRTVILATHSAAAHVFVGRRLDLREGAVVQSRGAA